MNPSIWMAEAIALSSQNAMTGNGGPFGAVVVRAGEIIARGANQVTSSHDPTAHAEVVAIRQACQVVQSFKLEGCIMVTSCEPCPMCLAAIYWARIDKIYFANTRDDAAAIGFDDEFLYREIATSWEQRKIPTEQLRDMHPEALAAFAAWAGNLAKTPY